MVSPVCVCNEALDAESMISYNLMSRNATNFVCQIAWMFPVFRLSAPRARILARVSSEPSRLQMQGRWNLHQQQWRMILTDLFHDISRFVAKARRIADGSSPFQLYH